MSQYRTIKDQNGKRCKIGDLVEPLVSPYGVRRIVAIYDAQEMMDSDLIWRRKAELDHIAYREGKHVVPVRLGSASFRKSKEKQTRCMSYCFCHEAKHEEEKTQK
jgi:hypothetical protein